MSLQITKTNESEWKPLIEKDVKTDGIFIKILRFDENLNRAPTFLLKFNPGASYPNHNHPAGEEVFILEGEVRFGPNHLKTGDYLYTPPGAKHSVFSKTGCVALFVVPQEVEIL
jgi:quercetin dioxygenase-like cupin family protein